MDPLFAKKNAFKDFFRSSIDRAPRCLALLEREKQENRIFSRKILFHVFFLLLLLFFLHTDDALPIAVNRPVCGEDRSIMA
jgi:hypothetical protein